jgi:peptidoglycan/LPS O-acetylase OafA/YrhL
MEPPAAAQAGTGPAPDTGTAPSRFLVGDALRGLAATAVVLYHCAYFTDGRLPFYEAFPGPVGRIFNLLDLGLWVFFALSGYLVARPFVQAYVLGRPRPNVSRYTRNRLIRIVPLFWAIITIVLVGHLIHNDIWAVAARRDGVAAIATIYAFGQNYKASLTSWLVGPAWTLDLEAAFYVVVPIAGLLAFATAAWPRTPKGRVRMVLASCVGVAVVSYAFRVMMPATLGWTRAFPAMAVGFAPGVALAAVEPQVIAWLRERARWAGALPWGVLAATLAAVAAYHLAAPGRFGFDPTVPAGRMTLAALVGGGVVAVPLVRQWGGAPAWRVLDNGPMRWLGERSYGLYLWHQAVIIQLVGTGVNLQHSTGRTSVLFVETLALSLFLASLTYRFVERPFLRLRAERVSERTAKPSERALPTVTAGLVPGEIGE